MEDRYDNRVLQYLYEVCVVEPIQRPVFTIVWQVSSTVVSAWVIMLVLGTLPYLPTLALCTLMTLMWCVAGFIWRRCETRTVVRDFEMLCKIESDDDSDEEARE